MSDLVDLSNFLIDEDISIFKAASIIDQNGRQIVFVCRDGKLVAALSDGDIRRHVLRSGDFSLPVKEVANYSPKYVFTDEQGKATELLRKRLLKAVPIVNSDMEIVSIQFDHQVRVTEKKQLNTPLVIMAGGKGTRLAPYTNVLPKPLIPIGEKTITEHILDRFASYGCPTCYMIVNYKKELIKAYFNESPYRDAPLQFVEEAEYLGTGGGLKLLSGLIEQTFFLSNCDVLLDMDLDELLALHKKKKAVVTMVCAMKKVSVPYGTVELDASGNPLTLVEKPTYSMLTNTGLYVMEPSFLEHIPENTSVGVPEIIQKLIDLGRTVAVYPVSESAWMDMGEVSELNHMRTRFEDSDE